MSYVLEQLAKIKAELGKAKASVALAEVQVGLFENLVKRMEAETEAQESAPATAQSAPPTLHDGESVQLPATQEPLVINDEWRAVLDLLHNGREHVFLTGGAGAGKSTLLGHFVEHYDGVFAILAPTGVAALRVQGQTIHSFFGFGAHALDKDDIRKLPDDRRRKFQALRLLIIDEISMVRADMMDAIDHFLRVNRENSRPFGGVRLVMVGDLFQLPPVAKEKDEKRWLEQRYGTDTPYFFHAQVWRDAPLKTCALTTIFRQKDPQFTDALNAIRSGAISPEHLSLINQRVHTAFRPSADELWLTLTTTNNAADQANQRMLHSLNTPSQTFEAVISGEFDLKNAPTDQLLTLKPGLAVMFIRNNKDKGYVNGTLGKVTQVNPLIVEAQDREIQVEPEIWEQLTYEFSEKDKTLIKKVKGKFVQIPLKLAAAITIHKSQGLSLDRVIIDLANGAFAAGQTYVALSRCRTLEGMVLSRPLRDRDLITSDEVRKFMAGEPIARNGQLQMFEVNA
jgi:ATP-dependent DNA helicase PIF1